MLEDSHRVQCDSQVPRTKGRREAGSPVDAGLENRTGVFGFAERLTRRAEVFGCVLPVT